MAGVNSKLDLPCICSKESSPMFDLGAIGCCKPPAPVMNPNRPVVLGAVPANSEPECTPAAIVIYSSAANRFAGVTNEFAIC